jgi:hypothetical protein
VAARDDLEARDLALDADVLGRVLDEPAELRSSSPTESTRLGGGHGLNRRGGSFGQLLRRPADVGEEGQIVLESRRATP